MLLFLFLRQCISFYFCVFTVRYGMHWYHICHCECCCRTSKDWDDCGLLKEINRLWLRYWMLWTTSQQLVNQTCIQPMYLWRFATTRVWGSMFHIFVHIPIHALWFSYHSVEQTIHTIHHIYNKVIIFQLVHVSGLTSPANFQGVHSCIKQLFNLFIISSAVNTFKPTACTNPSAMNHTPTNLRQFCYVLEMIKGSNDCFMLQNM